MNARSTDPDTSHEAAATVANTGQIRSRILEILSTGYAWTDDELIATFLPGTVSPSGVRTRRNELVKDGLVRRSERDGTTASGRRCSRWEKT